MEVALMGNSTTELKKTDEINREVIHELDATVGQAKPRRKRVTRLFPALTYEECLSLCNAIWEFASGQRIRRLTLFDQMEKSPESGSSRTLITASN